MKILPPIVLLLLLGPILALAVDFVPQGNIDLKWVYSIYNASNLKGNGTLTWTGPVIMPLFSGGGNASWNESYARTIFPSISYVNAQIAVNGNWSADKSSYVPWSSVPGIVGDNVTKSYVNSQDAVNGNFSANNASIWQNASDQANLINGKISDNTTWNQSLADGRYYLVSNGSLDNRTWNQTYADGRYYLVSNGSLDNASWNQSHATTLYYPISSNPNGFINSTNSQIYNDSAYCAALVSNNGNWTLDKTSYYTSAQVNSQIAVSGNFSANNATIYAQLSDIKTNVSNAFSNDSKLSVKIDSIGNWTLDKPSYAVISTAAGWTNKSETTRTLLNVNVSNGNLTVTNGYLFGQPLLGMMGSGIINSTQSNQISEVNITCSGLTCSWNTFVARLVSGTSDQFAKYCVVAAGSKTATNNQHDVFYVDNNCAVQETSISTWFDSLLSAGGQWDFGNMVCYASSCEVQNGIGLEQRRMMKQRIINYNKNHLSVTNGLGETTGTWPNWTLSAGKYIYLMDVVSTTQKVIGATGGIEVIKPNGSTTTWVHVDENQWNLTYCTNGTAAILCSPTNRWRRYFFFVIGYNESGLPDNTGVHQLLATNSVQYTSEALCLDTTATPLTYVLPDYYQKAAVPLWAYCARPADTSWSSTGWIDLRTVKTGSVTSSSSSVFVPYSGATQNVELGGYNLTATYIEGNVNLTRIVSSIGNFSANNATIYAQITDIKTNVTNLWTNASNQDTNIATKALPGACAAGTFVNATTTTGVLCGAPAGTSGIANNTDAILNNLTISKNFYLLDPVTACSADNTFMIQFNGSTNTCRGVNTTALGFNNLSLPTVVTGIGNWSADRAGYSGALAWSNTSTTVLTTLIANISNSAWINGTLRIKSTIDGMKAETLSGGGSYFTWGDQSDFALYMSMGAYGGVNNVNTTTRNLLFKNSTSVIARIDAATARWNVTGDSWAGTGVFASNYTLINNNVSHPVIYGNTTCNILASPGGGTRLETCDGG